eukprot:gene5387-9194_t
MAFYLVGSGKSASDNLLTEEDKSSLKSLTKNATFLSVTKKGRYLGGALLTFSLLGFYALVQTNIQAHDAEATLIGKVLGLFHFNAFMVDFISSFITKQQGPFFGIASPHLPLFLGFLVYTLKYI